MRLLLMACICRANNDLPVYVGVHLSTRVATWPGVHSRYSLLLLVLCRTLDEIQQLTLNQIDLSSSVISSDIEHCVPHSGMKPLAPRILRGIEHASLLCIFISHSAPTTN